jgi:RHS repeat-associated protein
MLNNATLSYDVENRLSEYTTGSFVENYAYDEAKRRVDRWSGTTYDNVYFYGPKGKLLTVMQLNFNPTAPYVTANTLSNRIYFGKMLLGTTNGQVNTDSSLIKDRLGSVRPSYAYGTATGSGEQTSPGDDFATYWKDSSTGFEYAMNRYYSMGYGRFLTVDPFGGSARVGNPGSMNYAGDDPVNLRDPSGLDDGDASGGEASGGLCDDICFSPIVDLPGDDDFDVGVDGTGQGVPGNSGSVSTGSKSKYPKCNPTGNALTMAFLDWSSWETGYGQNKANLSENNDFGQQNPNNAPGNWDGSTAACNKGVNNIPFNTQNACIAAGSTWT